jgi:hypothetical protein
MSIAVIDVTGARARLCAGTAIVTGRPGGGSWRPAYTRLGAQSAELV